MTGDATAHTYELRTRWTGNSGSGTSSYGSYSRDFEISRHVKPVLLGSADHQFRGDPARFNPEELLVAALSSCHLLWYLHLCADQGVVVEAYEDEAVGSLAIGSDGTGHFSEVVLRPRVTVASPAMVENAIELHRKASQRCFIASSVNFPVRHEPQVTSSDR